MSTATMPGNIPVPVITETKTTTLTGRIIAPPMPSQATMKLVSEIASILKDTQGSEAWALFEALDFCRHENPRVAWIFGLVVNEILEEHEPVMCPVTAEG